MRLLVCPLVVLLTACSSAADYSPPLSPTSSLGSGVWVEHPPAELPLAGARLGSPREAWVAVKGSPVAAAERSRFGEAEVVFSPERARQLELRFPVALSVEEARVRVGAFHPTDGVPFLTYRGPAAQIVELFHSEALAAAFPAWEFGEAAPGTYYQVVEHGAPHTERVVLALGQLLPAVAPLPMPSPPPVPASSIPRRSVEPADPQDCPAEPASPLTPSRGERSETAVGPPCDPDSEPPGEFEGEISTTDEDADGEPELVNEAGEDESALEAETETEPELEPEENLEAEAGEGHAPRITARWAASRARPKPRLSG